MIFLNFVGCEYMCVCVCNLNKKVFLGVCVRVCVYVNEEMGVELLK